MKFKLARGFPNALVVSRCKSYVIHCALKVEISNVCRYHGVLVELAVGNAELIKCACDSLLSFPRQIDSGGNEGIDVFLNGTRKLHRWI